MTVFKFFNYYANLAVLPFEMLKNILGNVCTLRLHSKQNHFKQHFIIAHFRSFCETIYFTGKILLLICCQCICASYLLRCFLNTFFNFCS